MPVGDCCGYRIFYRTDDGEYKEIKGIEPVRDVSEDNVKYPELKLDTDCTIHMTITRQDQRKMYRMVRAQMNRQLRIRRRVARNTERARRMALKRGVNNHG